MVSISDIVETRELSEISPDVTMPKPGTTRHFQQLLLRLSFLSATWIPIIALIWGLNENIFTMNWTTFSLIIIELCLHLAVNTFNDYFDWISGTDQINNDYFLQLSMVVGQLN